MAKCVAESTPILPATDSALNHHVSSRSREIQQIHCSVVEAQIPYIRTEKNRQGGLLDLSHPLEIGVQSERITSQICHVWGMGVR